LNATSTGRQNALAGLRRVILLIGIVTSRAKALGAQYLVSDVFRSNRAMITLARKSR
jgi:hypothetical protein